jgi:hypothetical protein
VWNGSGWVLLSTGTANPVGLELVKTQTIGSAVSSVTVSDVFNSSFDSYLITVNGGAGTGASTLGLRLGSTASGYYQAGQSVIYSGTSSVGAISNATVWTYGGVMTTDSINVYVTLLNPNLAKRTYVHSQYVYGMPTGGGDIAAYLGYLNDTTSYTAFTLITSTGTMTGGTIRVYGYRNS